MRGKKKAPLDSVNHFTNLSQATGSMLHNSKGSKPWALRDPSPSDQANEELQASEADCKESCCTPKLKSPSLPVAKRIVTMDTEATTQTCSMKSLNLPVFKHLCEDITELEVEEVGQAVMQVGEVASSSK